MMSIIVLQKPLPVKVGAFFMGQERANTPLFWDGKCFYTLYNFYNVMNQCFML